MKRPSIKQYDWNEEAFTEFVMEMDKYVDQLELE